MPRRAVFFDRDNTLIANDGYLGDPAGVVLIDGAADAVAAARAMGFAVVTVSNQSGVARGLFSEDDVRAVNARMDELLSSANPQAVIDRHEYCPYHPSAVVERYRQDSELRKPKPGMLLRAAEALGLDLSSSWMIGDAPRDIAAGKTAGCRTILFHHPTLTRSAASGEGAADADFAATSLSDAIRIIATPTAEQPDHLPADRGATTSTAAPTAPPIGRAGRALVDLGKVEHRLDQILREVRRLREQPTQEFAVSKLLAGITQVLSLAAMFLAYLNLQSTERLQSALLAALVLQTLTIALLLMGRQR